VQRLVSHRKPILAPEPIEIIHIGLFSILRLKSPRRIATPHRNFPLRYGINPSYRRPFTARPYLSVQTSNSLAQLHIKWYSLKSTITISPIDSSSQLPLQTKNPKKKESKQATMSAAPCEACNTIPRAVSEGYVEKGNWIEIAGLPTCPYPFPSFLPP
jgi:hypothetical protein